MGIVFRSLTDVYGYNSFCEVTELDYMQGSGDPLYFRLINLKNKKCDECNELRHLPSSTASIQFTFHTIDSNKALIRAGVMVYPDDDRSVFRVDMMPGDKITGVVSAQLTDGGKTINILLDGRINVITADDDRFFC